MNKLLVSFFAVSTAVFVGCGGGGGDDKVEVNDVTINYKTSAAYDLRQYIVPVENSINVYDKETYTNNKGDKSFKGDPERTTYTEKYDINGTKILVRDGSDNIDERYSVLNDRISIMDANNTKIADAARYADIGDYVLKIDNTITSNNIPIRYTEICKVIKHYDTKEFDSRSYTDVLKMSCTNTKTGTATTDVFQLEYNAEGDSETYFAKGIGQVYSQSVDCDKTKTVVNNNSTEAKSCEKEMESLISHNKI